MIPSTDAERLWFLQTVPALRAADPDTLVGLVPHLDEGHVPVGHVLADALASAAVTVVVDGMVEARTSDGHCRFLGPGAALGHVAGCDAPRDDEVVRAITPVVAVLLPARRFRGARAGDPPLIDEFSSVEQEGGG